MRDQAMHDLRVDEWDKRVVIPMHDQRRLPEFAEPGDAGPTHSAQHLIEVAEYASQVCGTGKLVCILGMCAHLPTVHFSGDLLHMNRVQIASWRGHLRQSGKVPRDHERPRSRADQDQPPTSSWILEGVLLGER